jgi:hypothetical protein
LTITDKHKEKGVKFVGYLGNSGPRPFAKNLPKIHEGPELNDSSSDDDELLSDNSSPSKKLLNKKGKPGKQNSLDFIFED